MRPHLPIRALLPSRKFMETPIRCVLPSRALIPHTSLPAHIVVPQPLVVCPLCRGATRFHANFDSEVILPGRCLLSWVTSGRHTIYHLNWHEEQLGPDETDIIAKRFRACRWLFPPTLLTLLPSSLATATSTPHPRLRLFISTK